MGSGGSSDSGGGSGGSDYGYGGSHPGYGQGNSGYGVPSSGGGDYSGTSVIDGSRCTVSETRKADAAMNATFDTSVSGGWGNQVSGALQAWQGVNYACATENLQKNDK